MYTNNPFIDNASNPLSRFPDINAIERAGASGSSSGVVAGAPANYNAYGPAAPSYGSYGTNGYPASAAGAYVQQQQQQQQLPAQSYAYAQQQPSPSPVYGGGAYNGSSQFMSGTPVGAAAGPSMSTMYGAQQSPSAISAYGGAGFTGGYAADVPYGPQQQLNAYRTGYGWGPGPNVAQQQQQTASFLAEFDPYSQIPSSSNSANGSNANGTPNGNNSNWREHPRDYIQKHKRELELWDPVSWKQVLISFDSLKDAWMTRKLQIATQIQQGGYYMSPQENAYLQSLQKDAENHIDSIMASKVQMQEVLAGYRLSSDLASRNRVRESVNAALRELPDWPPAN